MKQLDRIKRTSKKPTANVIVSTGHGINPLQKRVMTIQVAVIASGAKQSPSGIAPIADGDCRGALRAPRNDSVCTIFVNHGTHLVSCWRFALTEVNKAYSG